MAVYRSISRYQPGEPYEFWVPNPYLRNVEDKRYRCFRGSCHGVAVLVTDRDSHNRWHNREEH